jgi:hypothetical protein
MNKPRCAFFAIAAIFCLGINISLAQIKPTSQGKPVGIITNVVDLKYAAPEDVADMLNSVAKASGTILTVDKRNRVLLVTGDPERVGEIESLIRRLDTVAVPAKSIEITTYLLIANDEAGSPQNAPPILDSALKQLRATFNYKSYQLLDAIFLGAVAGRRAEVSGVLTLPEKFFKGELAVGEGKSQQRHNYRFSFEGSYLTREEKGDIIHLSWLNLTMPTGSISTNLDLRSGQTVVLGKAGTGIGNTAMIAVITAKVVD